MGASYDEESQNFLLHVSSPKDLFLFQPAFALIRDLRLFKPGHFTHGVPWVCGIVEFKGELGAGGVGACMWIDVSNGPPVSGVEGTTFHFEAAELESFKKLRENLACAFRDLERFPKWKLASGYFNNSFSSKPTNNQIIDLFICLEALLLQEADELTFRLATRAANLLGADAQDRKKLFVDIKGFYGLRSKIVHGEVLNPREEQLLYDVGRLRELVRRTLLCCIALGQEVGLGLEFFKMLDGMSLDDDLRKDLQQRSSKFFYLHTA